MPRPRATSSTATMTRPRSGTNASAAISARPTGQLVWAGAPPGGTSYEMFQTASGWQFYLLTNTGGQITRTVMGKKEPALMQFFQIYLAQHPPLKLANRSVARNAGNGIPANGITVGAATGTAVRRRAARRVTVTRSATAAN
jgi:hypothetical protein